MMDGIDVCDKKASISRPFFWVACAACMLLACKAVVDIVAELHVIPVRYLLARNDDVQWKDRDRVYDRAKAGVATAMALSSGNPEFVMLAARAEMDQCRHWSKASQLQQQKECFMRAADSLRSLVRISPDSASAWANLLLVKSALDEIDTEFFEVLKQCGLRGKNDFGVNRLVSGVGLSRWSEWDNSSRDIFLSSLMILQKISPKEAKSVADAVGKSLLYCDITRSDPRRHYTCKRKKPNKVRTIP